MKVFIVYCHPSDNSFTKNMCDAFYKNEPEVAEDVLAEHQKINSADAMGYSKRSFQ